MNLRDAIRDALAGGDPAALGHVSDDDMAQALVNYADTAPLAEADALAPIVTRASQVPFDPELDGESGAPLDDVHADLAGLEPVIVDDGHGIDEAADVDPGEGFDDADLSPATDGPVDVDGEPADDSAAAATDADDDGEWYESDIDAPTDDHTAFGAGSSAPVPVDDADTAPDADWSGPADSVSLSSAASDLSLDPSNLDPSNLDPSGADPINDVDLEPVDDHAAGLDSDAPDDAFDDAFGDADFDA